MKELNLRPSSVKSSIHQMQFYFNRNLHIVKQKDAKNFEVDEEDVVVVHNPFKFETIKRFEVGTNFVCYLTRD